MLSVNSGPYPLLNSNGAINSETSRAGKSGEFTSLLNYLTSINLETGVKPDSGNTTEGEPQQQFLNNVLQTINISKDSLLDSINEIFTSVFEDGWGSLELNRNEGLEENETSNRIMDLVNLNDPTQLDVSSIVSFVQFLSQFDLSTVAKNVNEADLSNVLKTISTIYQSMEQNEGQKVLLTEEQQQVLKNYIQQNQNSKEKLNILETAFRPMDNHGRTTNLSVFRNKQPISFVVEQINTENQVDGQVLDNNKETNVSQVVANLSSTDTENLQLPLTEQTGKPTEVKPIQFQPFTSTVAGTIEVVDDQNQPVTMERFIKDFESILTRSKFYQNGQMQRLTIQLKPEHLGTLKIELIQQQNELVAKITSTTAGAKEILESQIHALKQALVQQNVNITRIDVASDIQQQAYEGQSNQKGNKEQSENQQQQKDQHDESDDKFSDTFIDTLLNYEI